MSTPVFTATRLAPTIFAVTAPSYPPVYIKRFCSQQFLLHAGYPHAALSSYLETVPVSCNGQRPLNHRSDEYVLALLRMPHALSNFPASMMLASADAPPTYPPLPIEDIEDTAMLPHVSLAEIPLTAMLTPGVVPEGVCFYDPGEQVLFAEEMVGAVAFGLQSDVGEYWRSLEKVLEFLTYEDDSAAIVAGGVVRVDAVGVLEGMKTLLGKVLRGEVRGVEKGSGRGGRVLAYVGKEASFVGPECVFEVGRKSLRGMLYS